MAACVLSWKTRTLILGPSESCFSHSSPEYLRGVWQTVAAFCSVMIRGRSSRDLWFWFLVQEQYLWWSLHVKRALHLKVIWGTLVFLRRVITKVS